MFRNLRFLMIANIRTLSIIDIYVRSVPVDDVAKFVAQRMGPKQEPSILSVEAPETPLDFARLAGSQKPAPFFCDFPQMGHASVIELQ